MRYDGQGPQWLVYCGTRSLNKNEMSLSATSCRGSIRSTETAAIADYENMFGPAHRAQPIALVRVP